MTMFTTNTRYDERAFELMLETVFYDRLDGRKALYSRTTHGNMIDPLICTTNTQIPTQ